MSSVPAKIISPRLGAHYPRARLFDLIEAASVQPVTWVVAPPGAGKTTAINSYLAVKELKAIWYQVDSGDADPATFFHYLNWAAKNAAPRYRTALPTFTVEHRRALKLFSRRYFEALFGRLKTPAALVLDNYQEAAVDSAIHDILSVAAESVPQGVRLFILSRTAPPAAYARLHAHNDLCLIDNAAFKLTFEETCAIAKFQHAGGARLATPEQLQHLHERTDGWIAGLVLSLARPDFLIPSDIAAAEHQLLFDYFANEIFQAIPSATQTLLCKTALMPRADLALANALAEDTGIGVLLADFCARNYFVSKQTRGEVYQFHPLFHDFLLHQAKVLFPPEQLLILRARAATLLAAAGDIDAAAALWIKVSDWDALATHILKHAAGMAAQARFQTLGTWLRELPPEALTRVPWLRYWLGVCRMLVNPLDAIPLFEAAYTQFEQTGDVLGCYLAWAGAVDAISFAMHDYGQFDLWLGRLDRLIGMPTKFPSLDVEARVIASSLSAITWRQPNHPAAFSLQQRALDLLQRCTSAPVAARLGFHLFLYKYWYDANHAEIGRILDRFAQLDNQLEDLAFERILIRHVRIMHHAAECSPRPALTALEEALKIGERSGIHVMDHVLIGLAVYACLGTDDLKKGTEMLERMEESVQRAGTKFEQSLRQRMRGWRCALLGDFPAAIREVELAIRINQEIGAGLLSRAAYQSLALYQLAGGDASAAQVSLASIETLPGFENDAYAGHLSFDRLVVVGLLSLANGNESGAREAVARLVRLVRRGGYMTAIGTLPALLAQVCAFALERNIDVEIARAIIQRRRLQPPVDSQAMEQWPYPVKLYTLGRFEIVIDGKPLQFAGKAQKKPLELLMALVSLSTDGQEVSEAALSAALWCNSSANKKNASKNTDDDMGERGSPTAFAMTLHRLRKLLGENDAVLWNNRRVRLNPQKVWVDTVAFEGMFQRLGTAPSMTDNEGMAKILKLYQGTFLSDLATLPWTLGPRERLRAKFLRYVSCASQHYLHTRRFEEVLRLTEKGLEAEPLADELYFQRMSCQQAMGQHAEALVTYRRCEKMLSVLLGIKPSGKIQALYRALLNR